MITCNKCKKQKDDGEFKKNKKILKTCLICRESSRKWRIENKERVSKYNKCFNDKKKDGKNVQIVLGKKKDDKEWTKYNSQLDAAKKLNLRASNINKVIKGILKTTGGYIFKLHEELYKSNEPTWNEIKEENKYKNKCVGQPSLNRVLHEKRDNIVGKVCCCCKQWNPITNYNFSKTHWDKLRNDCKSCLATYRKENRRQIQDTMNKYEKLRKKTDPGFKLSKTLRSRIGSALSAIKAKKHMNTMELTGCDINHLKNHIEKLFQSCMTWENHGEWHIDHIIPCSSFDLTDKLQQQICFNWRNLQPLWKKDNLEKSNKFNPECKELFCEFMATKLNTT